MKIFAFIFARGDSKQLRNKNILNFYDKPLIAHSILLAKKIKLIDKVYVSTDNKKIEEISIKYGANIIKRPKKLARDNSAEWDAWQHAIETLNKKHIFFDIFVSLPATSPLRIKSDIIKCIKAFNKKIDLVATYQTTSRNPWFNMVQLDKKSNMKPINKSIKKIYRRQDAPKVFDMSTVCYVSTPNYILNNNYLFDGKIKGVEIPNSRAMDIDSRLDFDIALEIYKKRKSK